MSDDYEEEAVSEDYPNEGYIEKLEAERDRLRAERDDWRDTAEDGWKMMRAENERLRVCMAGEGERLTKSNRELRDENKRLRAEIARLDIFIVNLIILAREHGIDEKKIRKIERE